MGLVFEVHYVDTVKRVDIPKLDSATKEKIQTAIQTKLTTHPEVHGKPLQNSLRGYRRLRVGNYRVVFRIDQNKVLIFGILPRATAYKVMEKRV